MVRFKNRYLLTELVWADGKVDDALTSYDLYRSIKDSVLLNFGDVGFGRVQQSLNVKYLNPLTGLAIVRCSRADCQLGWVATALVKEVKGRAVVVRSLHTGGTIRSCQKAALAYNRKVLLAVVDGAAAGAEHKRKAARMLEEGADAQAIAALDT